MCGDNTPHTPLIHRQGGKMEFNVDVNYLKLGNKVFALKEVDRPDIDINQELKEVYEGQFNQFKQEVQDGIVQESQEDWNTQINHLDRLKSRVGDVQVPRGSGLVYVDRTKARPARIILYSPHTVITPRNYLRRDEYNWNDNIMESFAAAGVPTANQTDTVEIKIIPVMFIPMLVYYNENINEMYTPDFKGFHSYTSDGRICTGDHTASDFWNSSNFEELMNVVNWFSPANRRPNYKGRQYSIHDILNNDTILAINRREVNTWTV